MKVLIIGIDGATFDLMKPWVETGQLPHIKRLMNEGVYGEMETVHPPLTGPAWVSLTTGVNPGKHGVFDFMSSATDKIEFISSAGVKVPRLWEILNKHGKEVGVMNVPVTYPATSVKGFMISGFLGPRKSSYPAELINEVETAIGKDYQVKLKYGPYGGKEKQFIKEAVNMFNIKVDTTLYLLKNKNCDFFMSVFGLPDHMSHYFWDYMKTGGEYCNTILDAYTRMDRAIGDFLTYTDKDTNILLVSDHGFGSLLKMVNFNNYFAQKGFLKFKSSARIKALLFKKGFTPSKAFKILSKLGIAAFTRRIPDEKRNRLLGAVLSYGDLDWQNTIAYSKGHVGQIYLNRKAVEIKGLKYSEVRKDIVTALYELEDPETHKRIVKRVLTREEAYNGEYAAMGPDLVVVMDDYIAYPLFAGDNRIITEHILKGRSGTHRMNGVFIGFGPYFKTKGEKKGINITDVVPTVLDIFGVSIPEYIDGNSVEETRRNIKKVATRDMLVEREKADMSPEEKKELEKRLKALGYMD